VSQGAEQFRILEQGPKHVVISLVDVVEERGKQRETLHRLVEDAEDQILHQTVAKHDRVEVIRMCEGHRVCF
jgi:hypothetical protein